MKDREKLIELLCNMPSSEIVIGKRSGKGYVTACRIADHILADGWIRLPCKVGDTVWKVRPELCVYRENDACANYCEGFDTLCEEYEGGKWIEFSKFTLSMLDDIGKTVFLTREEAEKALKEGKG